MIPSSTSQALVSEASQTSDESAHKIQFLNAAKHIYQILIPAAILMGAVGWSILSLFGRAYVSNGYGLLIVLCVSTIFVAINWLGDTWLNIKKHSRAYFLMNCFNALVVVGFAYLLAPHGLIGIGLGWLIGQAISAAAYLGIFARSQLLSFTPWLKTSR